MTDFLETWARIYIPSQLLLLPLVVVLVYYRKKFHNYKVQWNIQRLILILTVALPLLLIIRPEHSPEVLIPVLSEVPLYSNNPIKTALVDNIEFSIINRSEIYILEKLKIPFNSLSIAGILLLLGIFNLVILFIREKIIMARIYWSNKISISRGGVKVIFSDKISTAFSYGLLKPKVFLPLDLLGGDEEIIIAHELNHIKDKHLMWLNLEVFLKKVFWFNPLFYYLNGEGNDLRELLCDQKSIEYIDPIEYGKALVVSAKRNLKSPNLSCVSWGGDSSLKKRINKLLSGVDIMPKGLIKLTPYFAIGIVILVSLVFPVSLFSSETVLADKYRDFIELSNSKGAFVAAEELNMWEVVDSIPAEKRKNFPFAFPIEGGIGRLTLAWGQQKDPLEDRDFFHTAFDITYKRGSVIQSTGDGEVALVGYFPEGYGNVVIIKHTDGFYSLYGQLDTVLVQKGVKVNLGDKIGHMGSTGRSTGPHLHYSIFHNPNWDGNLDTFEMVKASVNPYHFLPEYYIKSLFTGFDFNGKHFKEVDYILLLLLTHSR